MFSPVIINVVPLTTHPCFCFLTDSKGPVLLLSCQNRSKTETNSIKISMAFNPLNPELNPICYLLALLAHHFLHVSRIRVKSLTLRLLMAYIYVYIYMYVCIYIYIYIYIYGAHILDVSRSHTTTHHSR